jgi:hypothetical protein
MWIVKIQKSFCQQVYKIIPKISGIKLLIHGLRLNILLL